MIKKYKTILLCCTILSIFIYGCENSNNLSKYTGKWDCNRFDIDIDINNKNVIWTITDTINTNSLYFTIDLDSDNKYYDTLHIKDVDNPEGETDILLHIDNNMLNIVAFKNRVKQFTTNCKRKNK